MHEAYGPKNITKMNSMQTIMVNGIRIISDKAINTRMKQPPYLFLQV